MVNYKNSSILYFLFIFFISTPFPQKSLTVEISKVNSEKGNLLLSLYETETSFKNFKPDKYVVIKAKKGLVQFTFQNLDKSLYAIGILHDLNGNLLMDKNFFGWPKEGFGFSKDALGKFGPPSFNQAGIILESKSTLAKITMKYL